MRTVRSTSGPVRILLVDDHPVVRYGLEALLGTQADFEVGDATIARITPTGAMVLYVVIPVTNVGCRAYCFASFDAEYLDASSQVVDTPTLDVINGSVLCEDIPNRNMAMTKRHLVAPGASDEPARFELHGCTGI